MANTVRIKAYGREKFTMKFGTSTKNFTIKSNVAAEDLEEFINAYQALTADTVVAVETVQSGIFDADWEEPSGTQSDTTVYQYIETKVRTSTGGTATVTVPNTKDNATSEEAATFATALIGVSPIYTSRLEQNEYSLTKEELYPNG